MKSFYYDLFLMLMTYGILTVLSIKLMKARKRRNLGGDEDGGLKRPDTPIIPDLPEGVVWPEQINKEEKILV